MERYEESGAQRKEKRPQGRHAGSQSSADGGVTSRRLRISQLYESELKA